MAITELRVSNYRSIRSIRLPLRQLTVLVGANGVGKTNLYRALHMLQAAALGTLAEEIAREGGLGSVFWAGERKAAEKPRLVLEVGLDGPGSGDSVDSVDSGAGDDIADRTYTIELGFPPALATAAFPLEAQIKSERLTVRQSGRRHTLLRRDGPSAAAQDLAGRHHRTADMLLTSETALSQPRVGFPQIDAVLKALSRWRFYHGFRTDADSPLRRPALALTSPMLAPDGSNLAAVLATLVHIREDTADLDEAIDAAFPGARLVVPEPTDTAAFTMVFADLPKRAFAAHELSDGTLHFLALAGALLSYRLPPFIALNEPETSIHPELLPALAGIIGKAAARTQVWVVTHSQVLADALAAETGVLPRQVIRRNGGTWVQGLNDLGLFADED